MQPKHHITPPPETACPKETHLISGLALNFVSLCADKEHEACIAFSAVGSVSLRGFAWFSSPG